MPLSKLGRGRLHLELQPDLVKPHAFNRLNYADIKIAIFSFHIFPTLLLFYCSIVLYFILFYNSTHVIYRITNQTKELRNIFP